MNWVSKPNLGVKLNWNFPLSKNLVIYYLENEGTGNTIYDLSKYQNDGALTSTTWVKGKFGNCLFFDSLASIVTCENNNASLNFGTSNFSVSLWYQGGMYNGDAIFTKGWNTDGSWNLFFLDSTIISRFEYPTGGTGTYLDYAVSNFNTSLWHHFVVTYNRTAMQTFYADGIYRNQQSMTLTSSVQANTANNFLIGGHGTGFWLSGSVDNFMVFNKELSASEVRHLYREPFCCLKVNPIKYTTTAIMAAWNKVRNVI